MIRKRQPHGRLAWDPSGSRAKFKTEEEEKKKKFNFFFLWKKPNWFPDEFESDEEEKKSRDTQRRCLPTLTRFGVSTLRRLIRKH